MYQNKRAAAIQASPRCTRYAGFFIMVHRECEDVTHLSTRGRRGHYVSRRTCIGMLLTRYDANLGGSRSVRSLLGRGRLNTSEETAWLGTATATPRTHGSYPAYTPHTRHSTYCTNMVLLHEESTYTVMTLCLAAPVHFNQYHFCRYFGALARSKRSAIVPGTYHTRYQVHDMIKQ